MRDPRFYQIVVLGSMLTGEQEMSVYALTRSGPDWTASRGGVAFGSRDLSGGAVSGAT